MNNKNLRVLILGVGIGLMISSSLNLLFQSSNQKKITSDFIRAEARRLGMIDPKEYFDKSMTEQNQTSHIEEINQQPEIQEEVNVTIVIQRGNTSEDVAKLLKEKDLIGDVNIFLDRIYERKVSNRLQIGTYIFHKNMTIDKIIDAMTSAN